MTIMTREREARRRTEAMARRIRPLTVFYNGACPICRNEIRRYRDACADDEAERDHAWVDISEMPQALAARGIGPDEATRRLYVIDREGTLWRGVDAFMVLWRSIPRYRWLGRLVALPGIHAAAGWVYEHVIARVNYHRHRRRCRRNGGTAAAH